MGSAIPDAAIFVMFTVNSYTLTLFMGRCEDGQMHATYTFDSGQALSFHFLLNSLVNVEMCFVKVLKSPNRTILFQSSPLEVIYYG